jgi:hypothetical protein
LSCSEKLSAHICPELDELNPLGPTSFLYAKIHFNIILLSTHRCLKLVSSLWILGLKLHIPLRRADPTFKESYKLSVTTLQAGRSRDRIPGEVDFFNLPNPSSRTIVLGPTQPLTEMSTRNIPGG